MSDRFFSQNKPQAIDRRLTAKQAAACANVSTRTIKRYIHSGLLPYERLPSPKGRGHVRIKQSDLESLLAQGRSG